MWQIEVCGRCLFWKISVIIKIKHKIENLMTSYNFLPLLVISNLSIAAQYYRHNLCSSFANYSNGRHLCLISRSRPIMKDTLYKILSTSFRLLRRSNFIKILPSFSQRISNNIEYVLLMYYDFKTFCCVFHIIYFLNC